MRTCRVQIGGWIFLSLVLVGPSAAAQVSFSASPGTVQDSQRINEALAMRGSLEVVDMPLQEVAMVLSERFDVNIALSPKKLEEWAVAVDSPVTARLRNLPLESILGLMLRELELDFMVRDNVILITTADDANSPDNLEVRVYPVRDLVLQSDGKEDYEPLIELITTTVAPSAWDEVGGPGSIDCLANAGVLTVSQTWQTHRQLEYLLAMLRRAKTAQGLAPMAVAPAPSSARPTRDRTPVPRRYVGAAAQRWQVPSVHADE